MTGSIDLSEVRVIEGYVPLKCVFGVQMKSTDLSAETTWNLQFSNDGTNWANAKESGTDITGSITQNVVSYESFAGVARSKYRILFAGVTTGTVNYNVI